MVLVVGGRASGKRTYLRSLGFEDVDMADGAIDERPVVVNLHDFIAGCEKSPQEIASMLDGKEAISCCEVGNGIVPLDADERAWRERVGRTVNILADRADSVVRMVCGIPVALK